MLRPDISVASVVLCLHSLGLIILGSSQVSAGRSYISIYPGYHHPTDTAELESPVWLWGEHGMHGRHILMNKQIMVKELHNCIYSIPLNDH